MSDIFADASLFHDIKIENMNWGRDLNARKESDEEKDYNNMANQEVIYEKTVRKKKIF